MTTENYSKEKIKTDITALQEAGGGGSSIVFVPYPDTAGGAQTILKGSSGIPSYVRLVVNDLGSISTIDVYFNGTTNRVLDASTAYADDSIRCVEGGVEVDDTSPSSLGTGLPTTILFID